MTDSTPVDYRKILLELRSEILRSFKKNQTDDPEKVKALNQINEFIIDHGAFYVGISYDNFISSLQKDVESKNLNRLLDKNNPFLVNKFLDYIDKNFDSSKSLAIEQKELFQADLSSLIKKLRKLSSVEPLLKSMDKIVYQEAKRKKDAKKEQQNYAKMFGKNNSSEEVWIELKQVSPRKKSI